MTLSCVARVFLLCCSCAPLALRWHFPPNQNGLTPLPYGLDSPGLPAIQRKSHFSKDACPAAFHRRCQCTEVATLTGLEPVPPP